MAVTAVPGGVAVVYVTDDELGPGGHYEVGPKWRERFLQFIGGADLLIHDAMYTPAEYAARFTPQEPNLNEPILRC